MHAELEYSVGKWKGISGTEGICFCSVRATAFGYIMSASIVYERIGASTSMRSCAEHWLKEEV
jgi:hypothetical protein